MHRMLRTNIIIFADKWREEDRGIWTREAGAEPIWPRLRKMLEALTFSEKEPWLVWQCFRSDINKAGES